MQKILIIESVAAPYKKELALLYEEGRQSDQSMNYIALIPSESQFVKMLYRAGFKYVYKTSHYPNHRDFKASFLHKRRRTVLVASKIILEVDNLIPVSESQRTNRYAWYRFGIGYMYEGLQILIRRRKVNS